SRAPPESGPSRARGTGAPTPARPPAVRGLPHGPSSQGLQPDVFSRSRDRQMPLRNLLPPGPVERFGGQRDAVLERRPVEAGGLDPPRPARADELVAIAEQERRHRGAIQLRAGALE